MDPPAPARTASDQTVAGTGNGLAMGATAYLLWGLLPLLLKALAAVNAWQVLAQRVIWSAIILVIVVVGFRRTSALRHALRASTLASLSLSAFLIAANWFVYIWAIQNHLVLDASLGYFAAPLVSTILGLAFLREKLSRQQGLAIMIAAAGVCVMTAGGGVSWVSSALAISFGCYGLVRKKLPVDGLTGTTIESLLLAPAAVAMIILAGTHSLPVWRQSWSLDVLFALSGAATAATLVLYTAAAQRLPLATLGLLQYISPTLQLAEAVLLFGEHLQRFQALSFAFIWAGAAIYTFDTLRKTSVRKYQAVLEGG